MSDLLWVEKYRPKNLNDMIDQEEIVDRLKSFVEERNLPHLLFAGPPGTGKTTAALCLAYELYREDWRDNTLELNASDERGIDTIRNRIKNYARTVPLGEVPFKFAILDEADNMTSDAQQALRRTMELYSRATRFCLIVNYTSKIIEPIQSRCAIFRFKPLPEKEVVKLLTKISRGEGFEITDDGVQAILGEVRGDLRKAINILQSSSTVDEAVDEDDIFKVVGKTTPVEIRQMISAALNGDFLEARDMLRSAMLSHGLSGIDVLKFIHREIMSDRLNVPSHVRAELIDLLGEINFRMVEGADDGIQLSALLAKLTLIGKSP